MSRRYALVCFSISVGLLLGSCAGPSASQRYLDSIVVEGYRKAGEGPGTSGAQVAYYVGPASENINSLVNRPGGLHMETPTLDLTNGNTRHIGTGSGTIDGTVKCQILLFELAQDGSRDPFVGDGKLTEAEAAKVMDGSYRIFRLSVLCGSSG